MSAKLIVHKFESNADFKSLMITFEDGDENGSCRTRYSEWSDGKTQKNKRESQKSRLVVKIVSDNDTSNFDLDICAKELSQPETVVNNIANTLSFNNYNKNTTIIKNESNESESNAACCKLNENSYNMDNYTKFSDDRVLGSIKALTNPTLTYEINAATPGVGSSDCLVDSLVSPLEYSLEKVRENNARIMENIHLLNLTLNYTKKKEILETVCPKDTKFPCNSCGKCFVYKTGLKRHYSTRHAVAELQPRWQVVWTCIECFQVWPQHNLAKEHSTRCCKTDTVDCVREIKTSSLLQCEFCEKVYTSIPRLLRHSKIHTISSNYECNACESSFLSYKAAEQHWLLCPWLKMYYCFSLPKMLLCNTCDRKFRSYEQLYNHRYKVGHFMTKTHCNKDGIRTPGILVYQCEICAHWFNSIVCLQAHRTQAHSGYETYDHEFQYKMDNNTKYEDSYYEAAEGDDHHHTVQVDNFNNQYM